MNTFFKTFFICLVITFSFLAYKFVQTVGYGPELEVTKNHPVFGVHEEDKEPYFSNDNSKNNSNNDNEIKNDTPKPEKVVTKKYSHSCYFYSANGQLISITRELNAKPSTENSILLLLKGPTIAETKKGIYSEIPANVDLISLKRENNSVIVNLSSNFGNGGGTKSVENRVKQLSKTVKAMEPKKNVYLYLNNKEVEYLGGDGVYIKQPLE